MLLSFVIVASHYAVFMHLYKNRSVCNNMVLLSKTAFGIQKRKDWKVSKAQNNLCNQLKKILYLKCIVEALEIFQQSAVFHVIVHILLRMPFVICDALRCSELHSIVSVKNLQSNPKSGRFIILYKQIPYPSVFW